MLRLFIILVSLILPPSAYAMDFTIKRVDIRPVMPPALRITATGEITKGDTLKLIERIAEVDTTDIRDVSINFDSPGGSLMESLIMGEYIAELPAIVSAYVGSYDSGPAVCASACVYAYLAADYRYLSENGQIGIHRFGVYDVEMDGNQGAALGQAVSSVLSEYIRAQRARPELFEKISLIDHDDIYWVSRSELEQWRVVTNNIYDEQSEYINVNGKAALRLTQIAITGDSYLTLFCTEKSLAGVADLHEPELAQYGQFEVALDGEWYPIQVWDVVERGNHRGRVLFEMPPRLTLKAMQATSIGARITNPHQGLFFGFEQRLTDQKLNELIQGCPAQAVTAGTNMVDRFDVDFTGGDLTREGIRDISFAECKQICLKYADCQAVSYVRKMSWCWPKSHIRRQRATQDVISAFKR